MGASKGGGRREASSRGVEGEWIDLGSVRELIRLMDEHGLQEVEIANGDSRVRLVRDHVRAAPGDAVAPPPAATVAVAAAPATSAPAPAQESKARPIISPMVGTFYRAPSPDAPPFVEVGSIVEKGETLCIIEAMKMMNEIEAEFRGRVTSVMATNGETVEYGEELFLVEPL